jgi:hypothetical protein
LELNLEAAMTPTKVRWYARANEGSFKPVEGGYVFQAASPWVLARPSYYLVSAAKKAEISVHLARWRLLMFLPILGMICFLLPVIAFPSLLSPLYRQFGSGLFSLFIFTAFTLLMALLIAVPQIYLARALRPLLADAPRTEERIKLAEQLPRIAAAVSTKLLVMGLVSAVAMVVVGGALLLDAFLEGRLTGSALFGSSTFAVMGGLMACYFIFLLRLKAKAKPA